MLESAPRSLPTSALGQRLAEEPVITLLMREALARPGLLSLAAGFTDNTVLPTGLVEDAVTELTRTVASREFLQYGSTHGRPGLRVAVADWLARYPGEEGLGLEAENVLISNGSQQSLYMSAQLFCDPGDIVLVEAPSYFVFLELLRGLGLRAVSMPTRADGGVDLDGLAALCARWTATGEMARVKLLYFMGTYANPSARCWEEADKRALGQWLQTQPWTLPVIEDMAYRELFFESPWPARSVLSLPEWKGLPTLYAGTLTKPFATGLKVGYVVSQTVEWIEKLARIKGHQDFGTSNFTQAILESVITSGGLDAHLAAIRPSYRAKMEALDAALRAEGLAELGWHWERPTGGLLLWATAPEGWDTGMRSAFYAACLEEGVFYVPGDLCFAEGEPKNAVRLSYGVLDPEGLREAARRFVRAARRVGGGD